MFSIGATVVNFGQVARVVGLFTSADGRPSTETGWPILRRLDKAGRPNGGKWLADPAKCTAVQS